MVLICCLSNKEFRASASKTQHLGKCSGFKNMILRLKCIIDRGMALKCTIDRG